MQKVSSFLFSFLVPFILASALAGCAKESPKAEFASLKQTLVQDATKPEGSLSTEVTMEKSALLGREFLYSAGLQFSSIVDGEISTSIMAIALGAVPASFRVSGDKLQLVTDGRINFESDVNHPSRLIHEFAVVSQDQRYISFRVDSASPILDTFLFGEKNKVPLRYSFVRSFDVSHDDELFLIESTVELVNGSVGEFMESLRPRERVVPAGVKPIHADSDFNPLSDRYGFLDAGEVFVTKADKTRVKTKMATRFVPKEGEPVRWYVTPNIPDQYLEDVKNGVEGWNRYTRAAGRPDLLRFEGRLPEGVKVGDPRYNLIVWDNVKDAGAAYESQLSDPLTGAQFHSMIYVPLAWVNIGKDYWKKMNPESIGTGEERAARLSKLLKSRAFLGRSLPVHCMDSAELHVSEEALLSPEHFARTLLKGVVFHEVGHALGLAHNFKGSLSFDEDDSSSLFTTSIMDYNHYDEDDGAFHNLGTADGPLLEYDRQIVSVLYNQGKDVKDSDPELDSCDDSIADSTDGGVDPLCNRYDLGADVTVEAGKALDLFTKAGRKRAKMRSITNDKVVQALAVLPPAGEVKDLDALKKALSEGISAASGTVGIYVAASANSFGYLGATAVKSLKVFQDDVLPEEGYEEADMRERALTLLETAASMNSLPALAKGALLASRPKLLEYLGSTALLNGLPREAQEKVMAGLTVAVDKALAISEVALLSRMRTRFIAALASTPTAPLAFHERNGRKLDVEAEVLGILEMLASRTAGSTPRPMAERAAALKVLKSYARSENYKPIAERLVARLELEIHDSTDAMAKEAARKLRADFLKQEIPAKEEE